MKKNNYKNDIWEYICDDCYYEKYAVRNTRDKSINSEIRVKTRKEATFLVEQLNKIDMLEKKLKTKGNV